MKKKKKRTKLSCKEDNEDLVGEIELHSQGLA